jgi:hypothetical protein
MISLLFHNHCQALQTLPAMIVPYIGLAFLIPYL